MEGNEQLRRRISFLLEKCALTSFTQFLTPFMEKNLKTTSLISLIVSLLPPPPGESKN